jgi:PTH1 family peptidyl-tRNA hydrolase
VKVIVGLGNPGIAYEETRHNAGYKVIDKFRTRYGVGCKPSKRLHCELARCKHASEDVLLVKPLTYMNLSGQAVLAVTNWHKVSLSDILIIHDDVSLNLGKVRLQKHGSAGGQHGIESIIEHFGGSKNFDRLKIGIGPDPGGALRKDYVLAPFSTSEQPILQSVLSLAEEAAIVWLEKGIDFAMNKCNGVSVKSGDQQF